MPTRQLRHKQGPAREQENGGTWRVAALVAVLVLGCVGCGLSASEADWCRRPENRGRIIMTDSSLRERDSIASAWDAWVQEGQPPTGQLEDACHKAYESEQIRGSSS